MARAKRAVSKAARKGVRNVAIGGQKVIVQPTGNTLKFFLGGVGEFIELGVRKATGGSEMLSWLRYTGAKRGVDYSTLKAGFARKQSATVKRLLWGLMTIGGVLLVVYLQEVY